MVSIVRYHDYVKRALFVIPLEACMDATQIHIASEAGVITRMQLSGLSCIVKYGRSDARWYLITTIYCEVYLITWAARRLSWNGSYDINI